MKVGIVIFDLVEVLDFAGPYEVLAGAREGDRSLIEVSVVAEKSPVICRGGLTVIPDALFSDAPTYDVLVVPGGPGTRVDESKLKPVVDFIKLTAQKAQIVAGVCTGTVLMAKAGLLSGLRVTTHHNYRERLQQDYPDLTVVHDKVVDNGSVITSAGVSSGIDMALYLLKRLFGDEVSKQSRETIEYGIHM